MNSSLFTLRAIKRDGSFFSQFRSYFFGAWRRKVFEELLIDAPAIMRKLNQHIWRHFCAYSGFLFLLILLLTNLKASWAEWCFIHLSYYLVFAAVVLICYEGVVFFSARGCFRLSFLKNWWPGILFTVMIVAATASSIHPQLRVLSDETNLLAVSKSLAFSKTPLNSTMGFWYYDSYWPINNEIDKRPLLFPFLVSILHGVRGFEVSNLYIVNGLCLALFLFLTYFVFARKYDHRFGISAQLLLASQPLILLCAFSGGMDLLACVCLFTAIASAYLHLRETSSESFGVLAAALLGLANSRYESSLYCILILLCLFAMKKLKFEHLQKKRVITGIGPILCLPLFWQMQLKWAEHDTPLGDEAFGFGHLTKQFSELVQQLGNPSPDLPYANLLNSAGVILILFFSFVFLIRRRRLVSLTRAESGILCVVGACLGVSVLLPLSYWLGCYTHPASARMFLPLIVALSLSPIALRRFYPKLNGSFFLILATGSFIYYSPVAVENRFFNSLTTPREFRIVEKYLKEHASHRCVVVADRPGQLTALNYGAVDFQFARNHPKDLFSGLVAHLYEEVFVVQSVRYDSNIPEQDLGKEWELNPVYSAQIDSDNYLQISKVGLPRKNGVMEVTGMSMEKPRIVMPHSYHSGTKPQRKISRTIVP